MKIPTSLVDKFAKRLGLSLEAIKEMKFKYNDLNTLQIREELLREVQLRDNELRLELQNTLQIKVSQGEIIISEDGLSAKCLLRNLLDKNIRAFLIFDIEDLTKIDKHYISSFIRKNGKISTWIYNMGASRSISSFLLDIKDRNTFVRHINGDKLDFRRANLKIEAKTDYCFYGPDWPKARKKAMFLSNGVCQICRKSAAVHVHHKLPVRFFANPNDSNFIENLIAVCKRCHFQEHRNIRKNMPLFDQILQQQRIKRRLMV